MDWLCNSLHLYCAHRFAKFVQTLKIVAKKCSFVCWFFFLLLFVTTFLSGKEQHVMYACHGIGIPASNEPLLYKKICSHAAWHETLFHSGLSASTCTTKLSLRTAPWLKTNISRATKCTEVSGQMTLVEKNAGVKHIVFNLTYCTFVIVIHLVIKKVNTRTASRMKSSDTLTPHWLTA